MKSEQLVTWPHPFLESTASVELRNLGWPKVARLDARHERLANTELTRNVLLHRSTVHAIQHGAVTSVQGLHPLPLGGDDSERPVGLLGLDLDVWAGQQQKSLNIGRTRHGEAIKRAVSRVRLSPVLLNTTVAEPFMDAFKRRAVRVCETQPNAAVVCLDFDAALTVKKRSEIASEGISRKVTNMHEGIYAMAVPVMAWIGRRIAMVSALSVEGAA